MSEKTLVEMMQEMLAAMKVMTGTLEKLEAEQARLGKAMGESGIVLLNHAKTLNNLGSAVVRLWHEAKLPVNEAPETPPETVN